MEYNTQTSKRRKCIERAIAILRERGSKGIICTQLAAEMRCSDTTAKSYLNALHKNQLTDCKLKAMGYGTPARNHVLIGTQKQIEEFLNSPAVGKRTSLAVRAPTSARKSANPAAASTSPRTTNTSNATILALPCRLITICREISSVLLAR